MELLSEGGGVKVRAGAVFGARAGIAAGVRVGARVKQPICR